MGGVAHHEAQQEKTTLFHQWSASGHARPRRCCRDLLSFHYRSAHTTSYSATRSRALAGSCTASSKPEASNARKEAGYVEDENPDEVDPVAVALFFSPLALCFPPAFSPVTHHRAALTPLCTSLAVPPRVSMYLRSPPVFVTGIKFKCCAGPVRLRWRQWTSRKGGRGG